MAVAYSADRVYKDVGDTRQLFIDDDVIAVVKNVTRRQHTPQKHAGGPLIRRDKPWEGNTYFRNSCFNVIWDDKAEEIDRVLTPRTKAIIAVHMFGQVCDMDPIVELAHKHGTLLIEDVCQAPFAKYGTRTAGTIGDVGCYSFEAEKHLSTDHGGMAITDDDDLAAAIRYISHDRGASPAERGTRVHETIGHAFRYGRLEAAVGLAQLPAVPEQNRRRVEQANKLSARLREIDAVTPPFIPSNTSHVYWLYHFRVAMESIGVDLGEFIDALNAEGLRCGPAMYYLVPYSHTFIEDREASLESLPNAREHLSNTIRWPWTDKYSDADIEDIAAIIAKVADAYRK